MPVLLWTLIEGLSVDEITTLHELDAALGSTSERPAFFFKHSTACAVSAGALRRTNEFLARSEATGSDLPPCYLIKVIESRPVSSALAQKTGVEHMSPQILLVDQGRAAWHTSHFDINAESIEKVLEVRAAK